MKYVLITRNGRQFLYNVKDCAYIFQKIFGGEVHVLDQGTLKE